jgi:Fis family transcriptional regulator
MKTAVMGDAPQETGFTRARPGCAGEDDAGDSEAPSGAPSSAPQVVQLQVYQGGRRDPLSKCVEDAVRDFLRTAGDHGVDDLHQFVMAEVERPLLDTVMRHVNGNRSRAAGILGLNRATLRKRLKLHGLDD